ncbi:LVIVD repeat-containing protein [Ideonella sp. BN130291]|uniref:LVIVD repeat-containing protein n=1 Tax=Ideonella sp. BN130291 TaxID=3112940 RepID=UPI002E25AE49|nr:choice-of-anchor B family protein [Ideonella sp. BN130291]
MPALRSSLMPLLLTTLLAACGGGGSDAPPAPPPAAPDMGAELVSRVPASGVSGTWGYVAPDGSRYALMGTARGVLVLDLRNPAQPRVVDEVQGPDDTHTAGVYWREMRVYGSHAYIVSEHTNVRGGIMILDLAGLPDSVRYVRSVVPRDGQLAAHTVDVDTTRGLLYLQRVTNLGAPSAAGSGRATALHSGEEHPVGDANTGSVEIYDIATDPENPAYLTTFNQHRSVHDMTAAGDFVYVAEGNASTFSRWDVRDPRAPVLVSRWSVGGFAHSLWPSADGSLVITTEEIPNGLPARVWQQVGATPTQLATLKVGSGTPHNVIIEGQRAYFSHYTEGLAVYDLGNPSAPQLVAHLDTNALQGPGLGGCWGVYKFPGEPLVACSDMSTGFNLIRITN